jgi:hypothetical protein
MCVDHMAMQFAQCVRVRDGLADRLSRNATNNSFSENGLHSIATGYSAHVALLTIFPVFESQTATVRSSDDVANRCFTVS